MSLLTFQGVSYKASIPIVTVTSQQKEQIDRREIFLHVQNQ